MYDLFGSPSSRSTRIAWMLEELGVAWTMHRLNFRAGEHRSADYLAINPAGKVPALRHGDVVITETVAILRYLGARHQDAGLLPPEGTALGARCDQWLSFVTTELEQPLWTKAKHTFALPADWRVPEARTTADKEFARAAKVAETMLGDAEYAVGGHFTAADILLAHTCRWAHVAKQADALGPRLVAYTERMSARPALARAAALERG